jgi:hypothetical protein
MVCRDTRPWVVNCRKLMQDVYWQMVYVKRGCMYTIVVFIIYLFLLLLLLLLLFEMLSFVDPFRPVLPPCTGKSYPQMFNWWQREI